MNISNDGGGLSMTGVDNNESSVSGVDDRVSKIETLIKQFEMYRLPLLLDVKSSNGFGKNPPYEVVPFINFLSPLQIRTINIPSHVLNSNGTQDLNTLRFKMPGAVEGTDKYIEFRGEERDAIFSCNAYFGLGDLTKYVQFSEKGTYGATFCCDSVFYGNVFFNYLDPNDSITKTIAIGTLINKTLDIEAEQAEEEAKINALDTKVSSYDAKITKITADNAALDLKVSSFDSAIKNNTSLISASTANISKNTSDILQNKTAIDTNTLAISNNTNTIAQNTTDIAQNTTDIAQNTTKINNTIKEFSTASTLINASIKGISTALTFTIPLTLRPTDGQFLFYNGLHTKYISHMDNYTIYSITMLITESNFEINKNLATGTKLEAVLKLDFYGISFNPALADDLRDTISTTITIDRTNPGSRIIKVNQPLAINSYINAEEERRRYLKASLIHKSTNHILADFILNAKQ